MQWRDLGESVQAYMDQHALMEWLYFILLLLTICFLLHFIQRAFIRWLPQKASSVYIFELWKRVLKATTRLFLVGVALFFSVRFVELKPSVESLLVKVSMIIFWVQIGLWFSSAVTYAADIYVRRRKDSDASVTTVAGMTSFVLRMLGIILIAIIALDNIGFDVTTLIASLGIGGIAVALAVQNILGDLLASLSITLDKPFVVGDFIVMDNFMGSVEHVGLKTTRVRSLSGEQIIIPNSELMICSPLRLRTRVVFSGEQIIIPNSELLKGRIRNYKRMMERRVLFNFTVGYDTPRDTLTEIPSRIRTTIESIEKTRFDRCHLSQFGEFGFIYECVYFVLTPDYNQYMDIQQHINLDLISTVQELGAEFASLLQTKASPGLTSKLT